MQMQTLVDAVTRRKKAAPAGLKRAPMLSGGLPLLGHSVEFVRGAIELLYRAQRELGEVAAFDVFNRKMVAVFGPESPRGGVSRAPDEQLSPSRGLQDHDAGFRQRHRL